MLFPHSDSTEHSWTNEEYTADYMERVVEWVHASFDTVIPHLLTPSTANRILTDIAVRSKTSARANQVIILNLCDSVDESDAPGITVVRKMKELGLTYTGSDDVFWLSSASKEDAKDYMRAAGVPTAGYGRVQPHSMDADIDTIVTTVPSPWICKIGNDGGSSGISLKSVCRNKMEIRNRVQEMFAKYPNRTIFVETFLDGREYSVFVFETDNDKFIPFVPIERKFKNSLHIRTEDIELDDISCLAVDEPVKSKAISMAQAAHKAVKGRHYSRVDIRTVASTGEMYVLEVNAQPGIYSEEGAAFTHILEYSNVTIESFLRDCILSAANQRR